MTFHLRAAEAGDIDAIAELMAARREVYERFQPVFWRRAENATQGHAAFLTTLITKANVIALVAERDGVFAGFSVASLVPSPPVYNPGGPTCTLDDYAVVDDADWPTVGLALLTATTDQAQERGAAQVVVVCGHADEPKRAALRQAGLTIASEWWTAPLNPPTSGGS
ncbi:GNAT family N-acetyltransferase [Nonomuraea sp. NPDC050556]|uniref:GNAT family N-acetyltransferase n=1 Tax=Nonomuraea sp. NPDC050556 TaxID=3364369 RepID=UPI0037972A53